MRVWCQSKTNEKEMKGKLHVILCAILFIPFCLSAQDVIVRGKVTEAETSDPLPGVSILIEKSTRGVTTDLDGTFEIRATPSDKLVFSFLGMEPQTIEVGNKTYFEVELRQAISELDAVSYTHLDVYKRQVQIHGGKDNIIDNNIFFQCPYLSLIHI